MSVRLGDISLNASDFAHLFIVPLINNGYTDSITENMDFNNITPAELTHIIQVYNRISNVSLDNIQQPKKNYKYEERPKFDEIPKYIRGKD